jgi:hypothetical protein
MSTWWIAAALRPLALFVLALLVLAPARWLVMRYCSPRWKRLLLTRVYDLWK